MATTTIQSIQQLYVAYFNRPAEPGGLDYWVNALANGGTLTDISTAFSQSAEYKASFAGLSNDAIVTQIYQNLFNRLPDQSGLKYWSGHLADGSLSISFIVDNISSSAVNNPTVSPADTAAIVDKTAAAAAFTDLLNSDVNLRLAYSTPAAGQVAKDFLHGVTDDASLAAAKASLATTVSAALITAGQPIGVTDLLTIGQDTLVGTASNDTFNTFSVNSSGTVVNTVSAFDSIDGGAGIDTLNWVATATGSANLVLQGSVSNVEIINITGSDLVKTGTTGTVGTIDASFFAGATAITVDGIATTVTKVASGEKVTFNSHAVNTDDVVGYGSSVTSASIGVTGTSGSISVSGTTLATLSVDGTTHVTSGVADKLTLIDSGATVKTLNLSLTNDSEIDVAGMTKLTKIDASASTGGITIDSNVGGSVATILTGAGDDTVTLNTAFTATVATASVTTGTGDDTITVNVDTSGATGTYAISAGAGDDTITVTSALVAGDTIDGGDGADTVVLNGVGTGATAGAPYSLNNGDYTLITAAISNVETLEFSNSVVVDATKLTEFSTLAFDSASTVTGVTQALTAHSSLEAHGAGYVAATSTADATYAGSLIIAADGNGSTIIADADKATINVSALHADADAATPTTGDVAVTITGDLKTSLTVSLTNSADAATHATTDTIASASITVNTHHAVDPTVVDDVDVPASLSSLTSIKLTGNGSVVLDNSNSVSGGAATKLATIDASGLGGNYVHATGDHAAGDVTDGLTFTGNLNVAENITLGSGHDVLNVFSTEAKLDTITGFDAVQEHADGSSTVDTLVFGGLTIDGGATAAAAVTKVTLAGHDLDSIDNAYIAAAQASAAGATAGVGAIVTFTFGGNTYLFQDQGATAGDHVANGVSDANDLVVKVVGSIDFTSAYGTHHA